MANNLSNKLYLKKDLYSLLIGVKCISIYSMFLMCLCNLKARFTPLCANITLIPHMWEFCRYGKQSEQRRG